MIERPTYLLDRLTPHQTEAILFRGRPLLIIAGPGSGKTEVMNIDRAPARRSPGPFALPVAPASPLRPLSSVAGSRWLIST